MVWNLLVVVSIIDATLLVSVGFSFTLLEEDFSELLAVFGKFNKKLDLRRL